LLPPCFAAFASTAIAKDKIRSIPIDKDFQAADMRWSGATPGGYLGRIALKNNRGILELCGVGAVTNIQLSNPIKTALKGGKLTLNGKVVLKDFSYFAKARNKKALKSAKANCRSTGAKVPKKINSLNIEYGRAVFRN
jgi:hypothetical protein